MTRAADRLIAIVDLQQILQRNQQVQRVIERAQHAGVVNLLLRTKFVDKATVAQIDWPQLIASIRGQGGRAILHDSLLIAQPALLADAPLQHWSAANIWAYLKLDSLPPSMAEDLRRRYRAATAIGGSVHDAKELKNAEEFGAKWAMISPWMPSKSKVQRGEFLGPEGVRKFRKISSLPLFVLSGVSAQNLPDLEGTDVQGCATMGVLTNPHASIEINTLLNQMETQRWANPLPW